MPASEGGEGLLVFEVEEVDVEVGLLPVRDWRKGCTGEVGCEVVGVGSDGLVVFGWGLGVGVRRRMRRGLVMTVGGMLGL